MVLPPNNPDVAANWTYSDPKCAGEGQKDYAAWQADPTGYMALASREAAARAALAQAGVYPAQCGLSVTDLENQVLATLVVPKAPQALHCQPPFCIPGASFSPIEKAIAAGQPFAPIIPTPEAKARAIKAITVPDPNALYAAGIAPPASSGGSWTDWFSESMLLGIPNWALLAGGAGLLVFFGGRKRG
jgi:hypothetical protein